MLFVKSSRVHVSSFSSLSECDGVWPGGPAPLHEQRAVAALELPGREEHDSHRGTEADAGVTHRVKVPSLCGANRSVTDIKVPGNVARQKWRIIFGEKRCNSC